MEVPQGLVVALIVAGLVVCGVAIYALVEAARTMRSVRALSDELYSTLPPLIGKADVTVDAVNAELLRVDAIIGEVEEMSSKVGHTVTVVQDAVNVPASAVNVAGVRMREAWHKVKRSRGKPAGPTEEQ